MIRIKSSNGSVKEAEIEGNIVEILADLGVIVDTTMFAIAETPEDKLELLEEFIRLLKGAFEIIYKEDKQ